MAKSSLHRAIQLICAILLAGGLASGATKKPATSRTSSKKPPTKVASKTAKKPVKKTASKPAAKPAAKAKVVSKIAPAPAPPPLAPGELPLAARAALLLDSATGAVLYEKNADRIEYPASATKILTALLVLENGDLDRPVTIQPEDTKVEPTLLEVKPGEDYSRKQLLVALLLKSANDVAQALARDNAGSVEAFCEKMNRRAEALGANSSHFTNPHGLHHPRHFTTARDLALIALAAMRNPLFREIVSTPEVEMEKGGARLRIRNHNKLLWKLDGCNGIKTGFTNAAQQVLVSSVVRGGKEALSVVLHTNKPGIWEDSRTLLEHGLAKLGVPPAQPASAEELAPLATEPPTLEQGSAGR